MGLQMFKKYDKNPLYMIVFSFKNMVHMLPKVKDEWYKYYMPYYPSSIHSTPLIKLVNNVNVLMSLFYGFLLVLILIGTSEIFNTI